MLFYLFCLGLLLLWAASHLNEAALVAWRKAQVWGKGLFFMAFSKDNKWKAVPDSARFLTADKSTIECKTLFYIRHGESDWNEVFNRGFGPSFPVRLGTAIAREAVLAPTRDSVFLDSPLGPEGLDQADDLDKALRNPPQSEEKGMDEYFRILNGESGNSVIVSSNLRRCLATTFLGLRSRILKTNEKIHILSSLQEISRNVDTLALGEPGRVPRLPKCEKKLQMSESELNKYFDVSLNAGNKTLEYNGMRRMLDFAADCFKRPEDNIIIGGHSLYGKEFFKTFIPLGEPHIAKEAKVLNGGVVAFQFYRAFLYPSGEVVYYIDPQSIRPVVRGFGKPKKSKK